MPNDSLSGKVAIVIGAGNGAGEAAARALAAAGMRVAVGDLNPDRAERVAAAIAAAGGQAFAFQADVTNKFQLAALIESTRDRYGALHALVNNAHVAPEGPALKMDEWDLRRTVEVNLVGAFMAAQLAGRVIADEGGGAIVLLRREGARGAGAAATQGAIAALAGALDRELVESGVTVAAPAVRDAESAAEDLVTLLRGALPAGG